MPEQARPLQLTQREVELLLKYAYPFDEQEEQLRSSKASNGYHRVAVDWYWIEHWIADLVRCAKTLRSARLLDEMNELCCVLENAEHHDSRLRGVTHE